MAMSAGRPSIQRSSCECRWMGRQLPLVKFLNGREMVVTPEKFTSDVPGAGTCKRMQASFVPFSGLSGLFKCTASTSGLL